MYKALEIIVFTLLFTLAACLFASAAAGQSAQSNQTLDQALGPGQTDVLVQMAAVQENGVPWQYYSGQDHWKLTLGPGQTDVLTPMAAVQENGVSWQYYGGGQNHWRFTLNPGQTDVLTPMIAAQENGGLDDTGVLAKQVITHIDNSTGKLYTLDGLTGPVTWNGQAITYIDNLTGKLYTLDGSSGPVTWIGQAFDQSRYLDAFQN